MDRVDRRTCRGPARQMEAAYCQSHRRGADDGERPEEYHLPAVQDQVRAVQCRVRAAQCALAAISGPLEPGTLAVRTHSDHDQCCYPVHAASTPCLSNASARSPSHDLPHGDAVHPALRGGQVVTRPRTMPTTLWVRWRRYGRGNSRRRKHSPGARNVGVSADGIVGTTRLVRRMAASKLQSDSGGRSRSRTARSGRSDRSGTPSGRTPTCR
jgi:hypothetical protein